MKKILPIVIAILISISNISINHATIKADDTGSILPSDSKPLDIQGELAYFSGYESNVTQQEDGVHIAAEANSTRYTTLSANNEVSTFRLKMNVPHKPDSWGDWFRFYPKINVNPDQIWTPPVKYYVVAVQSWDSGGRVLFFKNHGSSEVVIDNNWGVTGGVNGVPAFNDGNFHDWVVKTIPVEGGVNLVLEIGGVEVLNLIDTDPVDFAGEANVTPGFMVAGLTTHATIATMNPATYNTGEYILPSEIAPTNALGESSLYAGTDYVFKDLTNRDAKGNGERAYSFDMKIEPDAGKEKDFFVSFMLQRDSGNYWEGVKAHGISFLNYHGDENENSERTMFYTGFPSNTNYAPITNFAGDPDWSGMGLNSWRDGEFHRFTVARSARNSLNESVLSLYMDGKLYLRKIQYNTADFSTGDVYPGFAVQNATVTFNYPTSVELLKEGNDYIIKMESWVDSHSYQIWSWQDVGDDEFGKLRQWVMKKPYTRGDDKTQEGFIQGEGYIKANIGSDFSKPEGEEYYTVAIRVIDENNNYVTQHKTVFTQAENEVVIMKVEVDGKFADERTIVKEKNGGNVGIEVFTNITQDVTYQATVTPGNTYELANNFFDWDISGLEPGRYTVTLRAENGNGTYDERTVRFNLYEDNPDITYGQMNSMTATGVPGADKFRIEMDMDVPFGAYVNYTISEPWRAAIHRSPSVSVAEANEEGMQNDSILEGQYPIYQLADYVRRSPTGSADDGIIRRVEYDRGGTKTLTVEVGETLYTGTFESPTSTQLTITPTATIDSLNGEQIVYSYWRRDARGWVMIRDYNYNEVIPDSITWTPARIGLYTIQVRAKGSDAGSYELIQNLEFNITGESSLLEVDNITLSGTDNVKARVPVTITADAINPTSGGQPSQDLLYKYIISNDYIYYVETAYSVDPTYVWIPGKAGTYRISVLVKSQESFGKYDDIRPFTIQVN